jgi:hypothetical protein
MLGAGYHPMPIPATGIDAQFRCPVLIQARGLSVAGLSRPAIFDYMGIVRAEWKGINDPWRGAARSQGWIF